MQYAFTLQSAIEHLRIVVAKTAKNRKSTFSRKDRDAITSILKLFPVPDAKPVDHDYEKWLSEQSPDGYNERKHLPATMRGE